MFLDNETIFATAHVPLGLTAISNVSTNVLDTGPLATGNLGRNLGGGEELWLDILCVTSLSATSTGTITFNLVTDVLSAMTTATVVARTPSYLWSAVTSGFRTGFALPSLSANSAASGGYERFIAVAPTITTVVQTGTASFRYQIVKKRDLKRLVAAAYTLDV